jgi:hypothetical protein
LIGVDYKYNITKEDLVEGGWSDSLSKSHFSSDYCAADTGRVWNLPHFEKTDVAFKRAAEWAKSRGVPILNATKGSKLDFFPRINYDDIFRK